MVKELQGFIKQDKVFFGMRECLKQNKKISKAFTPNDIRQATIKQLEKSGVEFEMLDMNKVEAAEKLGLGFMCEVFGVKK